MLLFLGRVKIFSGRSGRRCTKRRQLQCGFLDKKVIRFRIWQCWSFGWESETFGFWWDWHGCKGFGGEGFRGKGHKWACRFLGFHGILGLDIHRWTCRSDQHWFGWAAFHIDPGVVEDAFEVNSVSGWDCYAMPDEVFDFFTEAQGGFEKNLGSFDLVVGFKWDISTNHVIKENTEAPNGQTVRSVTSEFDPFRRGINSGTCNKNWNFLLKHCSM